MHQSETPVSCPTGVRTRNQVNIGGRELVFAAPGLGAVSVTSPPAVDYRGTAGINPAARKRLTQTLANSPASPANRSARLGSIASSASFNR